MLRVARNFLEEQQAGLFAAMVEAVLSLDGYVYSSPEACVLATTEEGGVAHVTFAIGGMPAIVAFLRTLPCEYIEFCRGFRGQAAIRRYPVSALYKHF